jgi:hypothetical protein
MPSKERCTGRCDGVSENAQLCCSQSALARRIALKPAESTNSTPPMSTTISLGRIAHMSANAFSNTAADAPSSSPLRTSVCLTAPEFVRMFSRMFPPFENVLPHLATEPNACGNAQWLARASRTHWSFAVPPARVSP